MNNVRRNKIKKEIGKLESVLTLIDTLNVERIKMFMMDVKSNIESVCDDEQDAFDNMPEGLQSSMRGETAEECIDLMTEAMDLMDEFAELEDANKEDIHEKIDIGTWE